jgi:hypothetical protein
MGEIQLIVHNLRVRLWITCCVTGTILGSSGWILAEDCNNNFLEDLCDIDCGEPLGPCFVRGCGSSVDCNVNGVPDECDLVGSALIGVGADLPSLFQIDPADEPGLASVKSGPSDDLHGFAIVGEFVNIAPGKTGFGNAGITLVGSPKPRNDSFA